MKSKNPNEIQAPQQIIVRGSSRTPVFPSVFLAGTIDMGESENWQKDFCDSLIGQDITILNPRRDDWNSSWKQHKDNHNFRQQVEWELNAMDKADAIIFNFLENSQSPVTMMELGLYLKSDWGKVIVVCPEGFYRSGNVHIVCEKYNIPVYDNIEQGKIALGIQLSLKRNQKNNNRYGLERKAK